VQRYFNCRGQIISGSAKNIVTPDCDVDIQVTIRATREADLALAAQLQPKAIFNSSRYVQVDVSTCPNPSLTSAIHAWILDNLTEASTGAARLGSHYIT
jgi:hypothetical protein